MKNIFIGIGLSIMLIITLSTVFTIDGRSIRNQEIQKALSESIDSSVNTLFIEKSYSISSPDELVADLLEALAVQIESESDLTINVLDIDEKKGLLSVEVIESFKHPNGKPGTVSVVKTVLFEPSETELTEQLSNEYVVKFLLPDGELYKCFVLPEGADIIKPVDPKLDDKTFSYWTYNDVVVDLSTAKVTEDISLVAVFK